MDIPAVITPELERELLERQPWMHPFRFAPDTIVGYFKDAGIVETACGPSSPPELIERMAAAYERRVSGEDGWQIRMLADRLGGFEDCTCIDIASATGRFSFQLSDHGAADVLGVEIRPEQVEQARFVQALAAGRFDRVRFEHEPASADESDYRSGEQFDVVLSMGLLYHLADPLQHLRNLRRLARRAVLVFTLAHFNRPGHWQLVFEDSRWITKATSGISWVPHHADVPGLLRAVGFAHAEELRHPELAPIQRRLAGLPRTARLVLPGAANAFAVHRASSRAATLSARGLAAGYGAYLGLI